MSRRPDTRRKTTRRTTLTLPQQSLAIAERLARERDVNLSVVVSEALADGLRSRLAAERASEVLDSYRQAFAGLTDDEMLAVDGVILAEDRTGRIDRG